MHIDAANKEKEYTENQASQHKIKEDACHTVVKLWMLTENGRVLLFRRLPGTRDAYLWENPSRTIDRWDTALQGILKELLEKAGIAVKPEDLILYDNRLMGNRLIKTFICKVPEQAICVMPDKIFDAKYFSLEDINKIQNELTDETYKDYIIHKRVIEEL